MSDVKIQRRLGVRTGYAPIIVLQGLYVPEVRREDAAVLNPSDVCSTLFRSYNRCLNR
jgi:hypothetical protein